MIGTHSIKDAQQLVSLMEVTKWEKKNKTENNISNILHNILLFLEMLIGSVFC